jgi:hypothetical protein
MINEVVFPAVFLAGALLLWFGLRARAGAQAV